VIQTLTITIVIEGSLCLVYSIWQKKPIRPILLTSLLGNIITQSLLWLVLTFFFQHYLATLLITETLIWLIEAIFFYSLQSNQLSVRESVLLSLFMNLFSFGMGCLLPI
jgi:hypothetical protein